MYMYGLQVSSLPIVGFLLWDFYWFPVHSVVLSPLVQMSFL